MLWTASPEIYLNMLSEMIHNQKESLTMQNTDIQDKRIAQISFATVYPLYLAKVMKKGRTEEELLTVMAWLTGYDGGKIRELTEAKVTFEEFFRNATLNPAAHLITGVICGYRVENIENPLTQQVRYLDKLVDELAKGRTLEKIMRTSRPDF